MYIIETEPFRIPMTVQVMDDLGIGGQLIGSIISSTSIHSRLGTDDLSKFVLEVMVVDQRRVNPPPLLNESL